jgi:hypothetical protein
MSIGLGPCLNANATANGIVTGLAHLEVFGRLTPRRSPCPYWNGKWSILLVEESPLLHDVGMFYRCLPRVQRGKSVCSCLFYAKVGAIMYAFID